MPNLPRFHMAFPVHTLAEARHFYGEVMGCAEGRSSSHWVDFDFFGHQIVAHLGDEPRDRQLTSEVDGEDVPLRHFGVILTMEQWQELTDRLLAANIAFVIPPAIRFKGQPGEQATCFLYDPSGNALEFKAFADDSMVFAR